MELEDSQIINLAVNIFHNVGIKRYIGQIQALRHEDIYFEIYKIIFPDSMINIFKISESTLTTGEKIQKIIEEISSIIKLDLYHISGEAIAQGNRNHLTNWLQLLEALSNNCIEYQTYHGGGSAPDRDREIYKEFQQDDYHTVQGVDGEFQKHVYTDQRPDETEDQEEQQQSSEQNQHHHKHYEFPIGIKKQKQKNKSQSISQSKEQDELNRSFRKSDSSMNSNTLKPIQPKKKSNKGSSISKNKNKKKVTFKIQQGTLSSNKYAGQNQKNMMKTTKDNLKIERATATSLHNPQNNLKNSRKQQQIIKAYGYNLNLQPSRNDKLLAKKKAFISKMHRIQQQIQQKQIHDQITKFQTWRYEMEEQSLREILKIEQQSRERSDMINKKINERYAVVNSLNRNQIHIANIKDLFQKQRQAERRMKNYRFEQQRKQALSLMDFDFAAEAQNLVMATMGQ